MSEYQMLNAISEYVDEHCEEAVSFLQELVRTPSISLNEAEVAQVIADKMRWAGFDSVYVDSLHDVMGTIEGVGNGRSILFNGHIDHVPVGDMVNPYSGEITEGAMYGVDGKAVYGRGASDMKASVAAMVIAGSLLNDLGIKLAGDFKVAAVSQEEIGGAGTVATIEQSQFLGDFVIIGEATNMEVALGHRGSTKAEVVVKGRSCHASAPERGINALYKATDLINKIRSDLVPNLPDHPLYGKTTLTAIRILVKPDASNVVPEECLVTLDCRYNPNFSVQKLNESIEELITCLKNEDDEFIAHIVPREARMHFSGYYTDPEEFPVIGKAIKAVSEVLGKGPKVGTWRFATDGRFYAWRGLPVFGFGPGEERFAHTHQDHVRIEDYLNSVKVYTWLACTICGLSGVGS